MLPTVFESLNVDAEMMDPTTLVIGTERVRVTRVGGNQLSRYLDCGGGVAAPNADSYDVTLSLFVQLVAAPTAGSTLVRTVLDAVAQSRYNQSDQVQCSSYGTLERRVVELIDQRLRNPSGVAERGPLRRPETGDFIRLTCLAGSDDPSGTSAGELLGIREGAILLGREGSDMQAMVPVSSVVRLEIRERRSRAKLGSLLGAAAGLTAGAIVGRSAYDRDRSSHYQPGVYTGIGAVLGAAGGAVLGRLVGSFVDYDGWVEGDPTFDVVRSEAGVEPPALTPSCPAPSAG